MSRAPPIVFKEMPTAVLASAEYIWRVPRQLMPSLAVALSHHRMIQKLIIKRLIDRWVITHQNRCEKQTVVRSHDQSIKRSKHRTAQRPSDRAFEQNKRVGERPRAQMNERPIDWLSARTNFRPNEPTVKSNHRTIELEPTYDRIVLKSME